MQTTRTNPSAQILAFPTATRAAAVILSRKAKFAADVAAIRSKPLVTTDAWYHQAAVEEERGSREH